MDKNISQVTHYWQGISLSMNIGMGKSSENRQVQGKTLPNTFPDIIKILDLHQMVHWRQYYLYKIDTKNDPIMHQFGANGHLYGWSWRWPNQKQKKTRRKIQAMVLTYEHVYLS